MANTNIALDGANLEHLALSILSSVGSFSTCLVIFSHSCVFLTCFVVQNMAICVL